MRTYSAHCVTYHAYRLQARAFVAGLLASLAFMGFALTEREPLAMAASILGALALGISIGAWTVGARFKD